MKEQHAKKLASLLKRLRSQYTPEEPPPRDPTLQMVVSFLQWQATRKLAEDAVARIMDVMVDVNDLRVSLEHEILHGLGEDYPQARERIARMREALNEVYVREHAVEMRSIAGRNKKEQRAYLDSLPGMVPYVAAQVLLLSFGGHAVPVDGRLLPLLEAEGVVDEGTSAEQAEASLQRMIKADENLQDHLLLQAWADDKGGKFKPATSTAAAARTKKTTKKTTKATTKRTTKKTTKAVAATASRRAKKK